MDGQPLLSRNKKVWYSFDAENAKRDREEHEQKRRQKKASVLRRLLYGAEERT